MKTKQYKNRVGLLLHFIFLYIINLKELMNMAVLKQKEVRTVRLVKKETTLPQDVWSMVSSYIKYAGIKGSQVDKRNFVVEGALKHLFESDKGFMAYIGKEAAAKREAATTIEQPKNR